MGEQQHQSFTIQMLFIWKWSEVPQSCLTLCDPTDCILPGSSVHAIFQEIVLEWIAISFSRGSSQPRARTQVSHIVDRRFTVWATREVKMSILPQMIYRFNAIPVKTPMALFVEKNSKIHMKSQGIQRAKTILKTENKTGGLTFPDLVISDIYFWLPLRTA